MVKLRAESKHKFHTERKLCKHKHRLHFYIYNLWPSSVAHFTTSENKNIRYNHACRLADRVSEKLITPNMMFLYGSCFGSWAKENLSQACSRQGAASALQHQWEWGTD